MASENLIILIGHVGKNPDVRIFENGGKVAHFTCEEIKTFKAALADLSAQLSAAAA